MRKMRAVCALVITLLMAAACDSREAAIAAPSSAVRAASPSENVVTIRVLGKEQYALEEGKKLSAGGLKAAVASRYSRGSGTRVVRVLGYPGITGYDVVLAVNAAREAGARRVDGIADYSDDGSTGNHKVWSEAIEPLPASARPDTARH